MNNTQIQNIFCNESLHFKNVQKILINVVFTIDNRNKNVVKTRATMIVIFEKIFINKKMYSWLVRRLK